MTGPWGQGWPPAKIPPWVIQAANTFVFVRTVPAYQVRARPADGAPAGAHQALWVRGQAGAALLCYQLWVGGAHDLHMKLESHPALSVQTYPHASPSTLQIYSLPFLCFVEEQLELLPRWPRWLTGARLRLVWRSAFVGAITLWACLMPFFAIVCGLVGSISFFPISCFFPIGGRVACCWALGVSGRACLPARAIASAVWASAAASCRRPLPTAPLLLLLPCGARRPRRDVDPHEAAAAGHGARAARTERLRAAGQPRHHSWVHRAPHRLLGHL